MIKEIHTTLTTYQGFQISADILIGDRWHYLAFGITDYMIDAVYGSATDGEVHESLRELARDAGEKPGQYAAGHMDHSRKLFEYQRAK
jgi:hypothetical protein